MRSFQEMISAEKAVSPQSIAHRVVKPDSSMRCAPMTRTRRSWSPSARSRTVRPSISAAKAASGASFGVSERKDVRDPGGRDLAADDALAGVGLQPIDAGRLVRQPLPDRQQQARRRRGCVLSVNSGTSASSACQAAAKRVTIRFDPMAFRHHPQGDAVLLHRSDQSDAPLDLAVVKHEARGRNLNGGTSRTLVDQQDGAAIARADQGRHPAAPDDCVRAG